MKIEELRRLCDNQSSVLLVLPRQTLPKTDRVRLTGAAGPLGTLLNAKEVGDKFEVVARFEARAILDWMDRMVSP